MKYIPVNGLKFTNSFALHSTCYYSVAFVLVHRVP